MFSSPTAIRVLKKQDPAYMKKHDLSTLKYLFLAGEPLDEPTARWASDALGVRDRRPLLADRDRLADPLGACRAWRTRRASSAARRSRSYGYDVRLLHEGTRRGSRAPTRRAC